MFRRLLVLLLLSSSAFAAPFVLSDLRIDSTRSAPREISVGGSTEGFLIAGLLSWTPGIIAVSSKGDPGMLGGGAKLDVQSANSVGEPMFVDGRWIVPIAPDFLAPDRIFLAQVKPDGTAAGETKMIPWPGAKGAAVAWNGTNLLLASSREHDFYTVDVFVRTASPDLAQIGDEGEVATGVTSIRLRAVAQQFVLAYQTPLGLSAVVLSADGSVASPPVGLSTNPKISSIDVIDFGGKPVITWAEAITEGWSYRIAALDDQKAFREISRVSDERIRAFARKTDEGIVVAWNGVHYDGNMRGREITWGILDANGAWTSSPQVIEGPGVLQGAASNGHDVLLVWDRHIDTVGTPMWGALVAKNRTPVAKFMAVDYARASTLAVCGSPDGTTYAVWVEESGVGESLVSATFDREGHRIGIHEIRSIAGVFGDVATASNGTETFAVFQDGPAIWGAYLGRDASVIREPFVIALSPPTGSSWIAHPTVTASPEGFLTAWIDFGGAVAATVSDGRVGTPRKIAVPPPPRTPYSGFAIMSVRVAVGLRGGVAAMDITEYFDCVGPPCPTKPYVGVTRFGSGVEEPVATLIDGGGFTPDVATDGRDYVVLWNSSDGIRERVIRDDAPDTESILFAKPASSPAIEWNGSGYSAAWSYVPSEPGRSKLVVADLSSAGEMTGPLRSTHASNTSVPHVAAFAGDALVSWIDRVGAPLGEAIAPVAEFERDMDVLSIPPMRRRALGR